MAGSFGFERRHYGVSQAIGERRLLPAVRAAAKDTLIIADGFSCREQIAQATDRRAVHLADVLALAQRQAHGADEYPEKQLPDYTRSRVLIPAAALTVMALLGLAFVAIRGSSRRTEDRKAS
jgi:hypothetical protein